MKELRRHVLSLPQGRTNGIVMRIAKFGTLDKVDLNIRAVDIGEGGVGIEADVPLEPGFVWFRDNAGGHKGGAVVWTTVLENNTCRAGISYPPWSRPGARGACKRGSSLSPVMPVPELVACMLVDEGPTREG